MLLQVMGMKSFSGVQNLYFLLTSRVIDSISQILGVLFAEARQPDILNI